MNALPDPLQFSLVRDTSGRAVWTPQAVETVVEYLKAGDTFAQVAQKFGVSRCTVAGVAHRAGFRSASRSVRKPSVQKAKGVAPMTKKKVAPAQIEMEFQPAAAAVASAVAEPTKGVSFFDLRMRHCRCVVGNDGYLATYCGEPTVNETSSWCAKHKAEFTRTSPQAWEKAAVTLKKGK